MPERLPTFGESPYYTVITGYLLQSLATDGTLKDTVRNIINVKDKAYGAQGDNTADDTTAIQAAFAAAAALAQSTQPSGGALVGSIPIVVFPPGIYKITNTITTSSAYTKVWGIGNPILNQTDSTKDGIDVASGYVVEVRGISFVGGKRQLRFGNNNLDTSILTIEQCEFHRNNGDFMLDTYLTGGATNLSLTMTVRDCKFMLPYKVFNGQPGVSARFQDTWVETVSTGATPPSMADAALFVNKGELIFDRMYGVPSTASTNARWIDNYGVFIADKSRFGAEGGGGLPIVYQLAGPLTSYPYVGQTAVQITNCTLGVGPALAANRGVVYFSTDIPQSIIIENNFYLVHDAEAILNAGGVTISTYVAALNTNDRLYIRIKGNQSWLPAAESTGTGIPTALLTTAPTKVYFEVDSVVPSAGGQVLFGNTDANFRAPTSTANLTWDETNKILGLSGGLTLVAVGTNDTVTAPAILLQNRKIIAWKDSAAGFTNPGYLYYDSSNQLSIGTANTQRLTIDSGGSVYLGSSAGGIGGSSGRLIQPNNTTHFWIDAAGGGTNAMFIGGNSSNSLILGAGNTIRITVTSGGIVSIGAPATTASAAAGDLVMGNNKYIRESNAGGTDTVPMIGVGTSDQVRIAPGGGDIQWGRALVALGGGAAATLGTIGGSGPATAAQNTWMRVLDSTGAAFWVPAWK